jgi:signal peptidase II
VTNTVSRKHWAAYLVAVTTIVLDQISKYWILNVFRLPAKGSVLVGGPFSLSMVWNRGVSFGLLRAEVDLARWALVGFSLIVAAFLAVWARKIERPLLALSVGLIMGGAVGNAIDRARFGAVADFLDFKALYFPWVFNVADSAITVGVILLLLDSVLSERRVKVRD